MHVPPVAEADMKVLMSDLHPEKQPCMCMRQRVGWVLNSRLFRVSIVRLGPDWSQGGVHVWTQTVLCGQIS